MLGFSKRTWVALAVAGAILMFPYQLLFGAFVLVAWAWSTISMTWENPRFASRFFAELLPDAPVVASMVNGNGFLADYGCMYAIVRLGPNAPATPPERREPPLDWYYVWDRGWHPTPAAPDDRVLSIISNCADEWPDGLAAELRAGLLTDGNYYASDARAWPENLSVYAPTVGVAAYIRYGD